MSNVRPFPTAPDEDDGDHIDRRVPADVAAEQVVLSGCMYSPAAAEQVNFLDRTDFYRPAHQLVWDVIQQQVRDGNPTDPIALHREIERLGQLRLVDGGAYLFTISQAPNVGITYYANVVAEQARTRRADALAVRIRTAISTGASADDIDQLIGQHQQTEQQRTAATTGNGPAHLMKSVLQWDDFFATDFGSIQLLTGRLMAPGQQITLVGDGKAGKSLFMQEWAWRMATGQPFLDDKPQEPVRILYLDAENGQEQVQERLLSFGAGPANMGLLTYASFPPVRPLDTPGGGQDLLALAAAVDAQLVVIDTVSRFISGPENDSDTWLSLYRNTLMPLKASGRASVRLDHFGKDQTRGSRGSSAKTQDVDHVWELTAQGGGILALKRTHTRTGVGPGHFTILRHSRQDGDRWLPGHTRHDVMHNEDRAALIPGSPEHIAAELDRAGVPAAAGRTRLRTECARLGIEAGTSKLEEVARIRKARENLPSKLPSPSEAAPEQTALEAAPETDETPDQTCPGQVETDPGQPPTNLPAPLPPLKRGQGGSGQRRAKPKCTICGGLLDPVLADQGTTQHLLCSNEIDEP